MTTGPLGKLPPADGGAALWLERHGAALRQYFRRRVHPADVDDLVQEVLLKLQTTAVGSGMSGAERYLFAVARNVLIDRHRAEATRDRTAQAAFVHGGDAADPLSPDRILIAREEYARVRTAILNLPPRARAAFQLHRFDGMTYAEIAATMRISKDTVKELMHRAISGVVAEVAERSTPDD